MSDAMTNRIEEEMATSADWERVRPWSCAEALARGLDHTQHWCLHTSSYCRQLGRSGSIGPTQTTLRNERGGVEATFVVFSGAAVHRHYRRVAPVPGTWDAALAPPEQVGRTPVPLDDLRDAVTEPLMRAFQAGVLLDGRPVGARELLTVLGHISVESVAMALWWQDYFVIPPGLPQTRVGGIVRRLLDGHTISLQEAR